MDSILYSTTILTKQIHYLLSTYFSSKTLGALLGRKKSMAPLAKKNQKKKIQEGMNLGTFNFQVSSELETC
jgi:hypothetical protein